MHLGDTLFDGEGNRFTIKAFGTITRADKFGADDWPWPTQFDNSDGKEVNGDFVYYNC